MELINAIKRRNDYTLEFKDTGDSNETYYTVDFRQHTSFDNPNEKPAYFNEIGIVPFPYDPRKALLAIPLHIADIKKRIMFTACFDFFAKQIQLPASISASEHPGYSLTVINFNGEKINEDIMKYMIKVIGEAIQEAIVIINEIEGAEPEEEDDSFDEVDENNVVEFELDDELKNIMKQPARSVYQPLKGEEDDD